MSIENIRVEVKCACNYEFIVSGNIPHATICNRCGEQISLRGVQELMRDEYLTKD